MMSAFYVSNLKWTPFSELGWGPSGRAFVLVKSRDYSSEREYTFTGMLHDVTHRSGFRSWPSPA